MLVMPPTKRLLQGNDDGEGHRWKVLRASNNAIDVFYGRGGDSKFQLKKEDKKVPPTEQLVLQRICEHRREKRRQRAEGGGGGKKTEERIREHRKRREGGRGRGFKASE